MIGESGQWIDYTVPFKVTENTTVYARSIDDKGNEFTTSCQIINIDRIAPVGTIVYNITELTNQDVIATLIFDESEEYIDITNGDSLGTYVFTENGEYTFIFQDQAGNVGTTTATVNNIDKIVPTATVEYSTQQKTNGNVTATLIPSEEVIITNNNGGTTYTFTNNNEFTFEFVDLAGNAGTFKALVNNIDKDPPTALFSYDITSPTEENVTVTLIPSENVTISNNNGSSTYTFSDNGTFTFYMIDEAGNEGFATAVVNNIHLSPQQDISLLQLKSPNSEENITSVIQGGSLAFIVKVIADKNGQLMLQLDCLDMNVLDNIDYSQEFFTSILLREAVKDQFGNIYNFEPASDGSKSFILKSNISLDKGIEYQIKIVISIGETLPKDSYQLKLRGTNQILQIDVVEIPPLL
jgi:hypothetical protein